MIGVLVPVHNEEQLLGACLSSVLKAARHPELAGEEVEILAVLDACTDGSHAIATALGVQTLSVNSRNVGHARSVGASYLLGRGARWLACTDADSLVGEDWLCNQLKFGAEAVCGTVHVEDWSGHSAGVQARYMANYQDRDGHRHIHGANLGVCAKAYRRVGGFRPLSAHEDVHLIEDLERSGARIVWTHLNRVITSARFDCRAQGGFSDYLKGLAEGVQP
ncbi:glycosyltransferase [Pseudomonas japonica]|uniref:glycosyltransferase n=1 Tax=Pseudomonas japonica TaxID=256466 RepID=UPI0015E2A41B|nr:glycosyltransferase [Pseudomonas japonica]MBA1289279.1 glycosyltransferase family 2 protein [Pseudomonas japonica]